MQILFGTAIVCLGFVSAGAAATQDPPAQPAPAQPAPEQSAKPAGDSPAVQDKPGKQAEIGADKDASVEPKAEAPKAEPSNVAPATGPRKKVDTVSATQNSKRKGAGKHGSVAVPEQDGGPKKILVRHGGVDEPTAQIVPGMPAEEANRQRGDAEKSLRTTDETLKRIATVALNGQQQETVSQIHNYMDGARSALKEGDIARAHTLAIKAGLLAEDLARR